MSKTKKKLLGTILSLTVFLFLSQSVSAATDTYEYLINKVNDTTATASIKSNSLSTALIVIQTTWAYKGSTMLQRTASDNSAGDGFAYTMITFTSGYKIARVKGEFSYGNIRRVLDKSY